MQTAPSPPLQAPEALGVYRVMGVLGHGGMGCVYAGEHTVIGRRVAIKLLNPEYAADAEVHARFLLEARIVNQIHHPNIVAITDVGTHEGRPFIVMEQLVGETLAERLQRQGALAEVTAVRIARQIASALGAAHERAIIHRDLKPANVFLCDHPDYPDFVKVLDFGIAKPARAATSTSHKTAAGTVLGTPAYMSPEQCLGDQKLDARSDIYALGVVLFEMVTGYPPFQGEGMGRLMLAHLQEAPPSATAFGQGVSREIDAVIQRSLAKLPAERWSNMRELRAALDPLAGDWRAPTSELAEVSRPMAATGSQPTRSTSSTTTLPSTSASTSPSASGHRRSATPSGKTPVALPALELNAVDVVDALAAESDRLSRALGALVEAGTLPLPPLPPLCAGALALAQSPAFSFGAALDIVRRDPRASALMVRMSNVEPYGTRAPAMNADQAIARLGALGLSVCMVEHAARPVIENRSPRAQALYRSERNPGRLPGIPRNDSAEQSAPPSPSARAADGNPARPLWSHALATAIIARRLTQLALPSVDPAYAYMSALVWDTARPVIADAITDIERDGAQPLSEAACLACIDTWQPAVALAIARSWRLPAPIIQAVGAEPGAPPGRDLPTALALASTLADVAGFQTSPRDQRAVENSIRLLMSALAVDEVIVRRATSRVKDWVVART